MKITKNLFYFLFVTSLIIGIALFFDIFNYQPRQNLIMAFKAFQKKDIHEFEKYADLDSVSMSLIDELFVLEKDLVGESIYDILTMLHGSPNGKPLVKKAVAKGLKEAVKIAIKNNHVEEKHPKNFGFGDVISVKEKEKVNDALVLTYTFKHHTQDLPVHFRMRKINGEWKLVGITHFKDAIKVYNPLRKKTAEEKEERKKQKEEKKKNKNKQHHDNSSNETSSEDV